MFHGRPVNWEGKKRERARKGREGKGGGGVSGLSQVESPEKVRELDGGGEILGVSGTLDLRYLWSRSWTGRTISVRLARLTDSLSRR